MVKESVKRVLTSSEDESSTGEDTLQSEDDTDYGTPVRPRQRFSSEETGILERAFKESARPTAEVKKELANQFGTLSNRIQIWFQNRRAKEKKISQTITQQSTENRVSKDTPRVKNPRVEDIPEPIVPLRPNVYYTEVPLLSGNDIFSYPPYIFTDPQNIDPGVGSSRGYFKRSLVNEDNSAVNHEKKEEDEVLKKGKKRSSRNPKNS